MCELLIFKLATEPWDDVFLECQRFHKGDVLVIADDEHPWTDDELSVGRVMRMTVATPYELGTLLGSDLLHTPDDEPLPYVPRIRITYVDADDIDEWTDTAEAFLAAYVKERPQTVNPFAPA